MSNQQGNPGAGLHLSLSEDGRKLLANYAPTGDKAPVDEKWLRLKIAGEGYDQLFLLEPALKQLIKQYASAGDPPFSLTIGEVRDAVVAVALSTDKMTAHLDVTAPCGGAPVSKEQIRQALTGKQVVSGILDEEIERIVAAGEAHQQLVAQGRAAQNGEDGRLQCLIDMVRNRHPHLDEHGVANYRDLGGIVTVRQGTRLMRRIAPTAGHNGENVQGQAILAKQGKDIQFATHLKGVQIDPADPLFLIADSAGQPLLVDNGMTIEPTISLRTVDLDTGNLDFEGSINIAGDVVAGMTVRASGDIHVGGTVEGAQLDAGGDVVIKGGVIGQGEAHEHAGENRRSLIARVHAGNSFSALFVENAVVEAGDSILVERLVMQSELAAVNQIVVGKPGSGRGSIIGGSIQATLLVQAAVIGSQANVKTRVVVGSNPYLQEKLRSATKEFEAKSHELEEIVKLLAFIAEHPGKIKAETQHKAENTGTALLDAIEVARQVKDELTQQLKLSEGAKVIVEKAVFSNVQVEIGSKIHLVNLERGRGSFSLQEGEIVFA
ncbi:MAG: DUF342 domain-containing protein [Sulfuricella sp.]|nr:DUF342 domain-containing protein [Sulfuricella sp.]